MSRGAFQRVVLDLSACAHLLSRAELLVVLEMSGLLSSKSRMVQDLVVRLVRKKVSSRQLKDLAQEVESAGKQVTWGVGGKQWQTHARVGNIGYTPVVV